MLLQSIAVLVSVLVRSAQYGDQYTKINQKRRKVPGFLRNQELFGGDYWTRTSDLLRVKEFAETGIKPLRRSWLRVLIFRILQHFLQMVARIRRNLPEESTVYDTTAL